MLDDSLELAGVKENIDDYCNLAILLVSRIINLLNTTRRPPVAPESGFSYLVNKARTELQQWRRLRPRRARALLRHEPTNGDPFPAVVYTQNSSSMILSTMT